MAAREQRLEDVIAGQVASQATGMLEVSSERSRWQLFFDGGELVNTRSNLKNEQEDALRRNLGPVSEAELLQAQAHQRLVTVLDLSAPAVTWKEGAGLARPTPLGVRRLLFDAVREARDVTELREALEELIHGRPVTDLEQPLLDLDPALEAYLDTMDGVRPGVDVLDFAPVEPAAVLTALWLGWRLGRYSLDGEPPDSGVRPVSVPQAPEPPPPAPLTPPPAGHPMADKLAALSQRIERAQHPYEVLGEPWDATEEVFRAAYMRLARDLHPDRYVTAPDALQELATTLFDKVRAAWEVMGDDASRQAYIDRVVHGRKSEEDLAMEQVRAYLEAENDFKRGLASFNAGRVVQAHDHFAAAVEKAPDELEFRAYLGYTSFTLNQKTKPFDAERGFNILIEAYARNAEQERRSDNLAVLVARAKRDRGDRSGARQAALEALKINAGNADAQRLLRRMKEEGAAAPEPSGSLWSRVSGAIGGVFKKKD